MTEPHAWTRADAAAHIRVPTDADDKYSRGVVGLRTGTPAYPGAAVLGVEGAWRAGAGMVRWVGDPDVGRLVLARRPETVLADGRVGAWVIGSGTDAKNRTPEEEAALRALLAGDVPVIVDAGALDLTAGATAPLILTPHAGEFARLRASLGLDERAMDAGAAVAEAAEAVGHVVLRKGADTLIASPDGRLDRGSRGDPVAGDRGRGRRAGRRARRARRPGRQRR